MTVQQLRAASGEVIRNRLIRAFRHERRKEGTTTVQHRDGRLDGECAADGLRRRCAESLFILSANCPERLSKNNRYS